MALPSPASVTDWSAAITAAVLPLMTGAIEIYDPESATTTPYDPATDTGGVSTPALFMAERPARIQQLTSTDLPGTTEWTAKTPYRIQIELRPGDPYIRKGLQVRVTNGDKDPSLTERSYEVISAVNSSNAAVRTINCVSDNTQVVFS